MTAAATESGSPLAPGYRLDRYELLCPIAEGGMASVWVARQRGKHGFEKLVAIKTILPKFASDARFQKMFLDEAGIASRIEHAHVARILDLGEENEILYLVMEYVDGDALSKLNRACQRHGVAIPPGVLMRVLADACAGLHDAHELRGPDGEPLGIVHRDVSPHNILVSARGAAKLIDFGIAKAQSRVGHDTTSGVLKGKIHYMAPEQALSRPVDRRADLWAVGAVLYHVLTGRPPYEGENQLATLHLLGSGRPPVPLPDTVHPAIRAVVRKALAHQPEQRYATAAELHAALEGAMVEARVPTNEADVAAFAVQHVGDRAERRRQSIDAALAAAAERRRLDSRPPSERPSFSSVGSMPAAPSSAALVAGEATAPPPDPVVSGAASVARLTPMLSEPPQAGSESYATLGSAALDASRSMAPPRSRRGLVAGLVGALALAGGGAALWVTVLRPGAAPHAAATVPPTAESAPPASAPAASASAAQPSTTGAPDAGGIPVISATALPAAAAPGQRRWAPPPPQPPVVAPQPQPPAQPPAAPKPRKSTVDDGF